MLRDSRQIADLYLENTMTTTIGDTPVTPASTNAGYVPPAQANEEKKDKELPEDNWIRFKHILKSDADIDEAAVKIARLLDNVSADRTVANEIVRLIRVKNNKFNRANR